MWILLGCLDFSEQLFLNGSTSSCTIWNYIFAEIEDKIKAFQRKEKTILWSDNSEMNSVSISGMDALLPLCNNGNKPEINYLLTNCIQFDVLIIEPDLGDIARPIHHEVSSFVFNHHILESTSHVSAIFIFNVKLTFCLIITPAYNKVF